MVPPALKKRTINVYLRSEDQKDQWTKLAEKAGIPLSAWVISRIEAVLAEESDQIDPEEVIDLEKENEELHNKVKELERQVKMQESLLDKQDVQMKELREQQWRPDFSDGRRPLDTRLIQLLRKEGTMTENQLMAELDTTPDNLRIQLDTLFDYLLAVETSQGWRWLE